MSYAVQKVITTTTTTTKTTRPGDGYLAELPSEDKHFQTLQWQTQHDVGEVDVDDVGVIPDGWQIDDGCLDNMGTQLAQTRAVRVREALFPETMDDGTYVLQTALHAGHITAVQKLSEPAHSLKQAVINLINYQEDADVALLACPDLIQLLSTVERGDIDTGRKAAQLCHQLSKKQACRLAFATSEELISMLIRIINISDDVETLRFICGALCCISHAVQGSVLITNFHGIPELVRLLSHPNEAIVHYCISTLHHILMLVEPSKDIVRGCGGVEKMCELLRNDHVRFLAILVDCLQILAFNHQGTKLVILQAGSIPELIHIVRNSNYEKLLFVTVRLLKVLSICSSNKPVIIELQGLQALSGLLTMQSQRVVMNVLWTVRNLSDQAYHLTSVDKLLVSVIDLLSSPDTDYVTCAAGILCNLTCNNPHNKEVVVQDRGIEALTQTLIQYQDREEITEPVVCALRHMTHRNDLCQQAQVAVRLNYGLATVVQLLESPASRWPLLKALVGLTRNLGLHPDNRAALKEHGALNAVMALLLRAHSERRDSISGDSESSYVDGIRLEDVVEVCLAALQILARDPHCRAQLRSALGPNGGTTMTALIVRLLYSPNEYVQRAAAGFCAECAVDAEGAGQLESEGATARLTELLHSRNEATATYAATVLYRCAEEKPADYRSRLHGELEQSLNRVDPAAQLANGGSGARAWGNPDAYDASNTLRDEPLPYVTLERNRDEGHDSWHRDLDV